MMSNYKIHPLRIGTITRAKSHMFPNCSSAEPFAYPLISFYLEGPDHKIIVDTGGDIPEFSKFTPYTRTKDEELDQALKNIGVDPKEIDIVILTHLHWDHASSNHLIPNARFICQKKEYENLLASKTTAKMGYDVEISSKTTYELVDGDCHITDGISVVLTPGHSAGMQCVIVETTVGNYIIAGDLVTVFEAWETSPRVPNNLAENPEDIKHSLAKIEAISNLLLPGHDPEVFNRRKVYP